MAVTLTISIDQNSQNITNNTSNVTVAVRASWTGGSYNALQKSGWVKIDGTTYNFTSSFNTGRTSTGTQVLCSKTVNVTHGSTGAKTLSCSASYTTGVSSGTIAASASKELTTIPRKSTLSVGNGTLGTAQTLKVTEQASSFTHTITAKCGTVSTTICTKSTNNSISFTPPLSWASQNTTGTSVSVTYTITTYSGTSSVGSNSYTKTCSIPSSVKPSVDSISISDTTGCYNTYGAYVKGFSKLKVTVTPKQAYGSPIASYKTTANGSTYTSASFTTGVLKSSGELSVSATVTDKRGRTSSASTKKISVLDYSAPNISKFTVGRCDEDGNAYEQGDRVKVTFAYSIVSLNGKNNSVCELKYKKSSETNYTVPTDFDPSVGEYIFPAITDSSYDVVITVTDDLSINSRMTSVSTAYVIMHWNASGRGVGIGKISEYDDLLDVGFQTRFFGGLLHPVLKPETDLNDVRTPNTYVGANISSNRYVNCPLTSGTFTLEVVGMGEDGQVKQSLTYCHKTESRVWERIYYSQSWGEWVCVSDFEGRLLWDGAYYMSASQTATLSETVDKQRLGIVLVFSLYDKDTKTGKNQELFEFFISKYTIKKHSEKGRNFNLCGMFGNGVKYLYLHNDKIVGHDKNSDSVTVGGITYDNTRYVLRHVIGI